MRCFPITPRVPSLQFLLLISGLCLHFYSLISISFPPDVCVLHRFFGGVVYVFSSVMCLLTDFWSSSFDLLLPFPFLHVSLTFPLPPSLCLDWGICGGVKEG